VATGGRAAQPIGWKVQVWDRVCLVALSMS